ncbi:hypothetical protein KW850_28750 [Bacillus sp. sid0103]|uniref:hypothetical protein n=1 Tax=Bacillus sp. sid0103 TaxID=2856337 RepID=UPI001C48BB92|nr:hypothetical protein [Bacillus sp. sid0103]MBV7509167.1 hypothetical protein [Bacillus sp. sid0103]
MNEGSKVISSKSNDKIEELVALQEKQKNYNAMLSDAKKLNQSSDYQKSKEKLDGLLKEDLTHFTAIKDEASKLKDTNDESIKKAEIAQAEKEAQEKAAAEEHSINGITAEEAINLAKRLPNYLYLHFITECLFYLCSSSKFFD